MCCVWLSAVPSNRGPLTVFGVSPPHPPSHAVQLSFLQQHPGSEADPTGCVLRARVVNTLLKSFWKCFSMDLQKLWVFLKKLIYFGNKVLSLGKSVLSSNPQPRTSQEALRIHFRLLTLSSSISLRYLGPGCLSLRSRFVLLCSVTGDSGWNFSDHFFKVSIALSFFG